jgi:site-specific DNA-cytosine methylase
MTDNSEKIILDLCAGTGAWSQPYLEAGYDVRRITLPGTDVRLYEPPEKVHGILAGPPCTHFASSGARWWHEKGTQAILDGLCVVDACVRIAWRCRPQWWVLENPVGRLRRWLGSPVCYFDPCDYGDPYTKKTALWGTFTMPPRTPVVATEGSKMHTMSKCPERAQIRSITPLGFAQAFFRVNP